MDRFLNYDWPGNVRQLQNVIRNVVVLNKGKEVELSMLPPPLSLDSKSGVNIASNVSISDSTKPTESILPSNRILDSKDQETIIPLWQSEKQIIENAIELCGGNIPQAAKQLEVSPSTIYRKLQSWNER